MARFADAAGAGSFFAVVAFLAGAEEAGVEADDFADSTGSVADGLGADAEVDGDEAGAFGSALTAPSVSATGLLPWPAAAAGSAGLAVADCPGLVAATRVDTGAWLGRSAR
jgi:hypothetical protein